MLEQEIAAEQGEVTIMYERLDVLREKARGELGRVQVEETTGTDQSWSERESFTAPATWARAVMVAGR